MTCTSQCPRSRIVCNISGLPEAVRCLVMDVLKGKTMVDLDELELSSALNYGGLAVLRGNRSDTTTLQWLLKTLQRRFGIIG